MKDKQLFIKKEDVVEKDDIATKREAYYVSKNWGDARFKEQSDSDSIMDDVEAMMMINREQLGFIPEEKGGEVAGKLIVIDRDPETKKPIKISPNRIRFGKNKQRKLRIETNSENRARNKN